MMEQESCKRCSARIDTSEQVERGQVSGILRNEREGKAGSSGGKQTPEIHSGEGKTYPEMEDGGDSRAIGSTENFRHTCQ